MLTRKPNEASMSAVAVNLFHAPPISNEDGSDGPLDELF